MRAAVAASALFPPLLAQLIGVGEDAGELRTFLLKSADIFEERTERATKARCTLAEPAMIVVFGTVVAFVALSLLQAIYGINARVRSSECPGVQRSRGGYTLMEMIIVMVIMAVASSLVAPALVDLGRTPQHRTAESLLSLLNATRRLAIDRNVTATLILDPKSGDYRSRLRRFLWRGLSVVRLQIDLLGMERMSTDLPWTPLPADRGRSRRRRSVSAGRIPTVMVRGSVEWCYARP